MSIPYTIKSIAFSKVLDLGEADFHQKCSKNYTFTLYDEHATSKMFYFHYELPELLRLP